jgi:hypothetical protein
MLLEQLGASREGALDAFLPLCAARKVDELREALQCGSRVVGGQAIRLHELRVKIVT